MHLRLPVLLLLEHLLLELIKFCHFLSLLLLLPFLDLLQLKINLLLAVVQCLVMQVQFLYILVGLVEPRFQVGVDAPESLYLLF